MAAVQRYMHSQCISITYLTQLFCQHKQYIENVGIRETLLQQ